MAQPSVPTVKRLFAVSGNRCAFPGCPLPLIDKESGKVTGKICHIKANNSNGPRYDGLQSEEERQGFDNLILLCPIHHDVIDSDIESYTDERLRRMKEKHEAGQHQEAEPSDALAMQFIANINVDSVTGGSVIYNVNQRGGQVAHSITNVGYQPKQIPQEAIPEFLDLMKSVGPIKVHITGNMLDPQTHFLANQLPDLLQKAGWQATGESVSMYEGLPKGIVFIVPEAMRESLPLDILAKFLKAVGFTNYRKLDAKAMFPTIVINAV